MGAFKPIRERLEARISREPSGCWVWQGAVRPTGYGVIGLPRGGVQSVHRVAYELYKGPIPEGLHIDHLCRNRICVNPAHLEAVTQQENNRRAAKVRVANKTHCIRGHEFTPDNTFYHSGGGRQCRACHVLGNRARRRGMTLESFARLLGAEVE